MKKINKILSVFLVMFLTAGMFSINNVNIKADTNVLTEFSIEGFKTDTPAEVYAGTTKLKYNMKFDGLEGSSVVFLAYYDVKNNKVEKVSVDYNTLKLEIPTNFKYGTEYQFLYMYCMRNFNYYSNKSKEEILKYDNTISYATISSFDGICNQNLDLKIMNSSVDTVGPTLENVYWEKDTIYVPTINTLKILTSDNDEGPVSLNILFGK